MLGIIPFLFGVIGIVTGAFAVYAAGGKNRQAAKHYKKVANELTDRYTNLEKEYHQVSNENKQHLDNLSHSRELIAENQQVINELTDKYTNLEKEYHRVSDKSKQHLDNLSHSRQLIAEKRQLINELTDRYTNLEKEYHQVSDESKQHLDNLSHSRQLIAEKRQLINELSDRYINLEKKYHQVSDENTKQKELIAQNKKSLNELNTKYSNLQNKYHQVSDENTKQRELIAQNTNNINELTDRYAKLEKAYHQLTSENTQYLDVVSYDSELIELLIEFEKESLGLAVELHQNVISLMCEINREPTTEIFNHFKVKIEETNQFLEEINQELIIIPDDYYESISSIIEPKNTEETRPIYQNILSIDLGRTSTKACVSRDPNNVVFIPANVKKMLLDQIRYFGFGAKGTNVIKDLWLEYENSGYALGQLAADFGANLGVGQSKVEDALVKVLAAAGYFQLKDEISVVIGIPFLSLEQFEKEKLELSKLLIGPHDFNFRGKSMNVNISKVWVMPEGYGSLLWTETQPNKAVTVPDLTKITVGIIDIGHQNIDMIIADNFRFARGASKSEDFGMSEFYTRIAQEIELADSQSLALIEAVNKPKGERFYRPRGGRLTNLDDFLPNLIEMFSREICSLVLAWLPEQVNDVIITGGGGEFFWEDLQRLLKDAHINAYLVAPSRQANALGQYIYAEAQLSAASRAASSENSQNSQD